MDLNASQSRGVSLFCDYFDSASAERSTSAGAGNTVTAPMFPYITAVLAVEPVLYTLSTIPGYCASIVGLHPG